MSLAVFNFLELRFFILKPNWLIRRQYIYRISKTANGIKHFATQVFHQIVGLRESHHSLFLISKGLLTLVLLLPGGLGTGIG